MANLKTKSAKSAELHEVLLEATQQVSVSATVRVFANGPADAIAKGLKMARDYEAGLCDIPDGYQPEPGYPVVVNPKVTQVKGPDGTITRAADIAADGAKPAQPARASRGFSGEPEPVTEYLVSVNANEGAGPETVVTAQFVVSIPKQAKPLSRASLKRAGDFAGYMLEQTVNVAGADCPFFNTLVFRMGAEVYPIREVSSFYVTEVSYHQG